MDLGKVLVTIVCRSLLAVKTYQTEMHRTAALVKLGYRHWSFGKCNILSLKRRMKSSFF